MTCLKPFTLSLSNQIYAMRLHYTGLMLNPEKTHSLNPLSDTCCCCKIMSALIATNIWRHFIYYNLSILNARYEITVLTRKKYLMNDFQLLIINNHKIHLDSYFEMSMFNCYWLLIQNDEADKICTHTVTNYNTNT